MTSFSSLTHSSLRNTLFFSVSFVSLQFFFFFFKKQLQFQTKDLHYIMPSSQQCGSLDHRLPSSVTLRFKDAVEEQFYTNNNN